MSAIFTTITFYITVVDIRRKRASSRNSRVRTPSAFKNFNHFLLYSLYYVTVDHMKLRELIQEIKIFLQDNTQLANADFFSGRLELTTDLIEGYAVIDRGNSRLVIQRPNHRWIIKIPIREKGIADNHTEFKYFKTNYRPIVQKAKCKLVNILEFPILIMEFVTPISSIPKPAWAAQIDNQQVGINRRGRIVSYDYAHLQR